jgi:periplasmic protein CpxP/Spy
MKTNRLLTLAAALLLSAGAIAQTTPAAPAPTAPTDQMSMGHPKLSREERVARKLEMKAKVAAMSPDERQTFKAERRAKLEQKWATMTPEQQNQVRERVRQRRAMKKLDK